MASNIEKSKIRVILEKIEDEIHSSWLKDVDKVEEIIQLKSILDQILSSDSIEQFFENNVSDFQYFISKFSYETISNLLRQHYVYGKNGDDEALEVLKLYLRIFDKFCDKSQYLLLFESIKDIFDFSKSYYRGHSYSSNKVINEKKLISGETFNEGLPKAKEAKAYEIGEEIDVLIENRKSYNPLEGSKVWTRGIIKNIRADLLTVCIAEDYTPLYFKSQSFEISPKGTMTKDYEWRTNLKSGDLIDCYDRGRWYPATILHVHKDIINGMFKVDYRIGFRIYTEKIENWKDFVKFWPEMDRDEHLDREGNKYVGDSETTDETITCNSKRIQPLNSLIHGGDLPRDSENFLIDDFILYEHCGVKNYIIAKNSMFSYYYAIILNFFAGLGGFERIIKLLNSNEKPHGDLVLIGFSILISVYPLFHKEYLKNLGTLMQNAVIPYLNDLTHNELRNIKKETIDIVLRVFKQYLTFTMSLDERDRIIEKFNITLATKMLKTSFLDKRIQAVKTLADIIRIAKNDQTKSEMIFKIIEESQIFYEIYGPNSHIQLINKSKDLLEIMLQEDKLSEGEIEMIWSATNKGDLEGKLTIIKTLKEVSKSLKEKHVNTFLKNIYSIQTKDLYIDEIELIYELSTHPSQNEESVEKCVKFFTETLLSSKQDQGGKTESLINKIYDITRLNPSFRSNVVELCVESLEKSNNVILSLKILQKFVIEIDIFADYDMNRIIVDNNRLLNNFIENFDNYMKIAREKSAGTNEDFDLLAIDDFPHSKNVKSRLDFIKIILKINLWRIEKEAAVYVYDVLMKNLLCENDSNLFFNWINELLDEGIYDEERIYQLFEQTICKNECQNLSKKSFECYLKIFLNLNQALKNLYVYEYSKKTEIISRVEPEDLKGFNLLWKLIFESSSKDIMNKGIELLHNLYKSTGEGNKRLLEKCLNSIKNTLNEEGISQNLRKNIIIKSILILNLMIEESEKRGTAQVKSHSCILRGKPVTIKIINDSANENILKVHTNVTIWDIKNIIASKLKISFDFLNFRINDKEIKEIDNGKTLNDLKLNEDFEIKVSKNSKENLIKQAELCNERNEVNPIAIKIFENWFERFSSEGKMSKQNCADFVKIVINLKEEVNSDDSRVKGLFETYDKNRDGFLEKEEFVNFYKDNCLKSDKRKTVFENMKAFKIRVDLKSLDEPLEEYNNDKNILPRFSLANNQELFDTLFKLQELDEEIANEAFKFLNVISTNPKMKERIYSVGEKDNINWEEIIDPKNIFKQIYSVQIIESILQEEVIYDDLIKISNEAANEKGIEKLKQKWLEKFIIQGGFKHLMEILEPKLNPFYSVEKTNILVELLLKIIKSIFVKSSFNYDGVSSLAFSEEMKKIVLVSINELVFVDSLIEIIKSLFNKENLTISEVNIIESSFDFISILLSVPQNKLENYIIQSKSNEFSEIVRNGILNQTTSIRTNFSISLIKMVKKFDLDERVDFITFIFQFTLEIVSKITKKQEKISLELFDFFSNIFHIYLKFSSAKNEFNTTFLDKISESINKDLNNDSGVILSNELFIGYLKILTSTCEKFTDYKEKISSTFKIIEGIMTKILFKQNSTELIEKLSKLDFINPREYEDNKSSRNFNQELRNTCYKFLLTMLNGSISNFEKFFSVNILENEKEEDKKSSSKESYYSRYNYSSGRNEGHVGLRNLGCICYMNAMLQQFFMVPSLRYGVLRINDKIPENTSNNYRIDDNVLHQVQRMFAYLEFSKRQDYNPQGFCYSFKDFEGNPTNTMIQQDSQEFLNRFFDKVESSLKSTETKHILQSIFGGKTCSQLICSNGCGNVSSRYEDFYNLSLEVNNMKSLYDSLEKFISPEKIDDFSCETCKKKVTITKRNSLAVLPNVLIVHLQRIFYNYEHDRNEKINSRLEFPRVLNLKPYTIEELTRMNSSKKKTGDDEKVTESEEIYFRNSNYYEYYLVGIVVHTGSADSGHYYSYINTVRNGDEYEMSYDHSQEQNANSWLEFNDSYISKFNIAKMEEECFGGVSTYGASDSWSRNYEKTKSAYMLVYERRIKSPLKMIIEESSIDKNLHISFKDEERVKIMKANDLCRASSKEEFMALKEKLEKFSFYDAGKNEYFKYLPFYYKEKIVPAKYFLEINEDNTSFDKHVNISDDQFNIFFENVLNVLGETVSKISNISEETGAKIATTFTSFVFKLLSQKDKQSLVKSAKEKFIHILKISPHSLNHVLIYLIENKKRVIENLLNDNTEVMSSNSELIFDLIEEAFSLCSEEDIINSINTLSILSDSLSDNLIKVIDMIFNLFPSIPAKIVNKLYPLLKLIYKIYGLGNVMNNYFFSREAIFIFVTYILGKESPCYYDTIKNGDHWDYARYNVSGQFLLEIIYSMVKFSKVYYETQISDEDGFSLSERDEKCIRHSSFLKYLFKNNEDIFSSLMVDLSYQNEEFTKKSCLEITKNIENIGIYNEKELVKIFSSITPLLKLNDDYQLLRFEIILGYPQILLDEPNFKCSYPFFGYNRMRDVDSKVFDYSGLYEKKNTSMCLLKKLFSIKSSSKTTCELFLLILEESSTNSSLLKYIRFLPSEDYCQNFDFINWGIMKIKAAKDPYNEYEKRLNIAVEKINAVLSHVVQNKNILNSFDGFISLGNKYLHGEIHKEIIKLVKHVENVFILQIEYYTSILKIDDEINFANSKMNQLPNYESLQSKEKAMSNQYTDDGEYVRYEEKYKNPDENEFLRMILVQLISGKKAIVESPNTSDEPSYSSLVRFVAFNNRQNDINLSFKINRMSTPESCNEYIPCGSIYSFVDFQSSKNLYTIHKLNYTKNWTDELELDFELEFSNVQYESSSKISNDDNIGNNNFVVNNLGHRRNNNVNMYERGGIGVGMYPSLNLDTKYDESDKAASSDDD